MLLKEKARLHVHDPVAMGELKKRLGNAVTYFENNYEALKGTDGLIIATEWNEFRRPDFDRMKQLMKQPVIFDGRNIYEPSRLKERGFVYYGVGRHGANGQ
jgi:UDPglucose 6-dehydrogenase